MKIRQHRDDHLSYELYSERESIIGRKSLIIWAVIHEDGLDELGLSPEDIKNCDYRLISKPIQPPS